MRIQAMGLLSNQSAFRMGKNWLSQVLAESMIISEDWT